MKSLKVLMWKHLMVRIRRFIHTPIEFISPVIFFVLLYQFRSIFSLVSSEVKRETLEKPNTEPFFLDTENPLHILYTPETALTNRLMDEVGKKLNLRRNSRAVQHLPGYHPFKNVSTLEQFVAQMQDDDAVIIFQDMNGNDYPAKLNYTIRMKINFQTHMYKPLDGLRPHEYFGDLYLNFMRVQQAVDWSFISLKSNSDITQTVSLQEFPYNGEEHDPSAAAIVSPLLQVICFVSLYLVFIFHMSRLLEERATGIQELIKMVGVSTHTLGFSHFLNVLPACLVFSVAGAIILKVSDTPLVPNSNGVLIFILLLLYAVSVISMAFVCSCVVKDVQYTTSIASLFFLMLWMPVHLAERVRASRALSLACGILPHMPMRWFWSQVEALEITGEGLSWSNLATSHLRLSGSVLSCYLLLVLQTCLCFALTWYLSLVRPGKHGQALPWDFVFKKEYWSDKKVSPVLLEEELEEPMAQDPAYFERGAIGGDVGIKINNVTKVYPKQKALSNVSLDVHKGEITVLLGHNGAGKTTLMSIITGTLKPTEGKVFVNGLDTTTQRSLVQKQLGLCPQHNLFFPDLTALQHLMFFTMLKGSSYNEAKLSSKELLKHLGLTEKEHSLSKSLSGGMKRRLQLACALTGGASVLILDEPTSGLDVETRRELWDMLLSLRGTRTILLSTHFMEEADALGDRVAALHAGRLRCYASTMHLKRAIGTGYRLTFTTKAHPKQPEISAVVKQHVPEATVKEQTYRTISYNLPAAASAQFPALFSSLESKRSDLGIATIGVGKSTLEDVFLKLCSDTETTFTEDDDVIVPEPIFVRKTGIVLCISQMFVLMKRQFKYLWFKKYQCLILQVLMPILLIAASVQMSNEVEVPERNLNPPVALNLGLYRDMVEPKVSINVNSSAFKWNSIPTQYPNVQFRQTESDVAEVMFRASQDDLSDYNKYLVGVQLNETYAKVLYTTLVRHAAPVGVNLMSNMLASQRLWDSEEPIITTYNHPILRELDPVHLLKTRLLEPKSSQMCITFMVLIMFITFSTMSYALSLASKERQTGTRHIHIMSGCAPELHWLATLLFHTILFLMALVLPTILAVVLLDSQNTLNQYSTLEGLAILQFLVILAFLPIVYLVSMFASDQSGGCLIMIILLVFGLITPLMSTLSGKYETASNVLTHIMPPHTFTIAAMKLSTQSRMNAYCKLNKEQCPNLFVPVVEFNTTMCCESTTSTPFCTICWNNGGIGKELIISIMQCFLYLTILLLAERGIINALYEMLANITYRPNLVPGDATVEVEKQYVNKAIGMPKEKITDALLVHDLHKNYRKINSSCNAVKGISFSVKKGECFGLLGVNGAGKSTTFKMLTAEQRCTQGHIFGNGHYHKLASTAYVTTLGYCPQFSGIDEFLTGRENLAMILSLRGLSAADVNSEVETWIEVVGLQRYMNQLSSGYSGGCLRRLSCACALSSGAPLTLLDEPTAGVDVAARRRVWAALRRALRHSRSVLITSHSMEEMEALCGRIAIMSGGRVAALGSPGELRASRHVGHALMLKLKSQTTPVGDELDSGKSEVDNLKKTLHEKFSCSLKDEHLTMLHYHISENLGYSELFRRVEALKSAFPHLIEDYSVTETTLEEVFLSFAKEPQSKGPDNV